MASKYRAYSLSKKKTISLRVAKSFVTELTLPYTQSAWEIKKSLQVFIFLKKKKFTSN